MDATDNIGRIKPQENILVIEDMCCDGEAWLIRAEIDGLKVVETYEINLVSQSIKVRFNPSILSVQNIITVILSLTTYYLFPIMPTVIYLSAKIIISLKQLASFFALFTYSNKILALM